MSKIERGTKRVCGGCDAKFYDLNKDPIVCPLCETVFVIAPPPRSRSTAAKEKPAEAPAEEAKAAPEAAPAAEDSEKTAAASASGPEIVSLDDVKAEEQDGDDDDDAAGLADVADIPDADDDDDDDDDTFLEDDDEEGADVADIIPVKVGSEGEDT